jgi:trimethylamine--corrinoid protein Co-methyltransferase
MVIDYECFCRLPRLFAGVAVDDETLALAAMREVGTSGEFLSSQHTLRSYRPHVWFPDLFHRGAWDAWLDSSALSPRQRATERLRELVAASDLVPAIAEDKCRDVDEVVRQAEIVLLGAPRGIIP